MDDDANVLCRVISAGQETAKQALQEIVILPALRPEVHTYTHTHTRSSRVTNSRSNIVTLFIAWCRLRFFITRVDVRVTGVEFSAASVCLCVCLSAFLHYISKLAAARITKLDREMFHRES